ncbi:MAG: carbon monoxide dehydrogenase [Peptococcaceae bacterium]|nr:carbon monoxide dehydrogenase [Peptococcaceae bacterium]
MKIAVAGKGGVGKTSISAGLIKIFAGEGPVWAIDADPDACLAGALGVPEEEAAALKPFSEMKTVIRERVGGDGGYAVLNPQVDDLLDKYALVRGNIRLLRMGTLKKGGAGCYCRENAFLNAIITSVLVGREEVTVVDLAAGIEQLSRGAARGVDVMVVVCNPTRASVSTARNIVSLAGDLGIEKTGYVGNRVRTAAEREFIAKACSDRPVLGYIGWYEELLSEELREDCLAEMPAPFLDDVRKIKQALEKMGASG